MQAEKVADDFGTEEWFLASTTNVEGSGATQPNYIPGCITHVGVASSVTGVDTLIAVKKVFHENPDAIQHRMLHRVWDALLMEKCPTMEPRPVPMDPL